MLAAVDALRGEAPPCEQATWLRDRAAPLLLQGKLHRALRVLDEADSLCPETSSGSTAQRLRALAEIGRFEEAEALAQRVLSEENGAELEEFAREVLRRLLARPRVPETASPITAPSRRASGRLETPVEEPWSTISGAVLLGNAELAHRLLLEHWQGAAKGFELELGSKTSKRMSFAQTAERQRQLDRGLDELERRWNAKATLELRRGYPHASALTFSPDSHVVALNDGADVVLIDAKRFVELRRIVTETDVLHALAFCGDGALLATTGYGKSLELRRVSDGSVVRRLELHEEGGSELACSSDGRLVAVKEYSGADVSIYDTLSGKRLHALPSRTHSEGVLSFSPDDAWLAIGDTSRVGLWDVETGRRLSESPTSGTGPWWLKTLAFSRDGKSLFGASHRGEWLRWRVGSKGRLSAATKARALRSKQSREKSRTVALAPDGSALVSIGFSDTLYFDNLRDGAELHKSPVSIDDVVTIAFDDDSGTWPLLDASGFLEHWAPGTTATRRMPLVHYFPYGRHVSPSFAAGGAVAALLWQNPGRGGAPALIRTSDGALVELFPEEYAGPGLALSQDGHVIAYGYEDREVIVRDVQQRDEPLRLPVRDAESLEALALSADGTRLAVSVGRSVELRRTSDGALMGVLPDRPANASRLAFSPKAPLLAVGAQNGSLTLWRFGAQKDVQRIAGPSKRVSALAFSADGQWLASAVAGRVDVWDVNRKARVASLGLHSDEVRALAASLGSQSDEVRALAFAPHRRLLATASADGTRLWDVEGQRELLRRFRPRGRSYAILLSPDGTQFDVETPRESSVVGPGTLGTEADTAAKTHWVRDDTETASELPADLHQALYCRVGPIALPVEICLERGYTPGLAQQLLEAAPPPRLASSTANERHRKKTARPLARPVATVPRQPTAGLRGENPRSRSTYASADSQASELLLLEDVPVFATSPVGPQIAWLHAGSTVELSHEGADSAEIELYLPAIEHASRFEKLAANRWETGWGFTSAFIPQHTDSYHWRRAVAPAVGNALELHGGLSRNVSATPNGEAFARLDCKPFQVLVRQDGFWQIALQVEHWGARGWVVGWIDAPRPGERDARCEIPVAAFSGSIRSAFR